jgi:hypothetical protein
VKNKEAVSHVLRLSIHVKERKSRDDGAFAIGRWNYGTLARNCSGFGLCGRGSASRTPVLFTEYSKLFWTTLTDFASVSIPALRGIFALFLLVGEDEKDKKTGRGMIL